MAKPQPAAKFRLGYVTAKGSDYDAPWFMKRCAEFTASSVSLKNPAWRDEREIRCHHVVVSDMSAEKWVLLDPGGRTLAGSVAPKPVQFESRRGLIVPFLDLPFTVSGDGHPVHEIVVGPKCATDESTLRFVLGREGYGTVPIRFAGSAYR
jgi:hypothetical protein